VGIDAPELILLIIVDERPIKEFDLASDNFFKLDCAAKAKADSLDACFIPCERH
jgi:hypothetical protein